MVPDKFNMVDMGGIDIIESQGVAVSGLYQKLVESIAQCRYQTLYNWKFDGILISPTFVELTMSGNKVSINGGITVNEEDIVRVYSIEKVITPVIQELNIVENGVYSVPAGVDGYSPINVEVPGTMDLTLLYERGVDTRLRENYNNFELILIEILQTLGGNYISSSLVTPIEIENSSGVGATIGTSYGYYKLNNDLSISSMAETRAILEKVYGIKRKEQ